MLHRHRQKKSNFPGIEYLAKLMIIISAKVKFQGFVQKTKQWSQIKNDFAKKKKFKDSHSLSAADNQTRKPDLKKWAKDVCSPRRGTRQTVPVRDFVQKGKPTVNNQTHEQTVKWARDVCLGTGAPLNGKEKKHIVVILIVN